MTVARTLGRLGNRSILDILIIKQQRAPYSDYSLNLSISYKSGMGMSVLSPFFLIEANLLPRFDTTTQYYLELDGPEVA